VGVFDARSKEEVDAARGELLFRKGSAEPLPKGCQVFIIYFEGEDKCYL